MAVVCPGCEVLPDPQAGAATPCRGCGARLVTVTATEPSIGIVVDGRFELRERLGAGAMGVVYRATQLSIGRDVALKLLTAIESASAVKRFFREARIASALSHPNTVPIIEFGQEPDGHVYLAMELVRGRTLLAELEQGPLSSRRITRIGVQLCDAIEAAHRLQIVHRDLKLENVMISVDGTDHIKVLDFGIARIVGDASSQVTATGLTAGTPHYMAPEVLGEGADPAPAQDVYAVGVILAELALGGALWTNVTSLPMLLMEKATNTAVERVPSRLRPLVERLLAPDPAARPTPAETRRMLLEIDRFATDPASAPPPLGPGMRARLDAAATANTASAGEPDPAWATLDLVGLDARDATVQDVPAASAFLPPPLAPLRAPSESGAAPGSDLPLTPSPGPSLEIEDGWERGRAARVTGTSAEARRAAQLHAPVRRFGAGAVVLVLAVSAAGAGAYAYLHTSARPPTQPRSVATVPVIQPGHVPASAPRPDAPRDAAPPPPAGSQHVSISVIGMHGVAITIDGAAAGALPLRLERSAGTRPIVIEGPGIYRRVIPDHTQTVDLSRTAP